MCDRVADVTKFSRTYARHTTGEMSMSARGGYAQCKGTAQPVTPEAIVAWLRSEVLYTVGFADRCVESAAKHRRAALADDAEAVEARGRVVALKRLLATMDPRGVCEHCGGACEVEHIVCAKCGDANP